VKRGMGSPNMSPETKRRIQSAGNQAMRAAGKSHKFAGRNAVECGRRGGKATAARRKPITAAALKAVERLDDREAAARLGVSVASIVRRRYPLAGEGA
jgi:hypothetical protein